ncbi:MAG: Asp-tRNA(Asn)/Glu-tRNA(Gln) amidotransferase subunit GatB [Armatimonadetes bacterium]|nr:Asp-tRNA(Asn)/Glu-tRNA(Gln) amidotransferase subunit GatB [Armatimonadota bacterium]HOM81625.1 Asp-tRNA(Asn)/Glu-tRNA(Gln) amidotransferase subunit GatB [Armatimonadota bacterium]HPO72360.1 Asp-tRNA(Asn)/Glu-tRNA(Gln) amidotransferase subunit GatB [Armatimonadota bacterium]
MTEYEPVIGMEVHAELLTESKMFCGCPTTFGAAPNTQVCPICLGLPGTLPVPNRRAVEFVVRAALALNCEISPRSIFYRKNYYYPDLPKAYQISQYGDDPIGRNGYIEIEVDGRVKRIGIRRCHLEEDTGKLFHVSPHTSEIDYNRSGMPLMEIVSEPDISSAEEARAYLEQLRAILTYLGVCDGKMEQGSLRCEPNVSVRPKGSTALGTKTELKNLNSFRAVARGIEYEIARQTALLREGGVVVQETWRWDEARQVTAPMRSKEAEQEYRYFPDPDLTPMVFDPAWIEEQRAQLPELPRQKQLRFQKEYGLPAYDAQVLTETRALAEYFEAAAKKHSDAKAVSNWVMGELLGRLNAASLDITESKISPEALAGLLALIDKGTISGKIAKEVFDEMFATGKAAEEIVRAKGLTQITDTEAIATTLDEIIAANPKEWERLKAGQEQLVKFFVGQVMRVTKGRANPQVVNDLLKERLQ